MSKKTTIVILAILFLIISSAGCSSPGGNRDSGKTSKLKVVELAANLVKNLGSEQKASMAVLIAWDKGYSVEQIVAAINNASLTEKGEIKGVSPENKPQNILSSRQSPASLAFNGLPSGAMLAAEKHNPDDFASEFDKKNIMWTAWLIAVIGKGYSTEQIVDFMLDHDKPVEVIFPEGVGPIISKKKIDPATGKIKINDKTGQDEEEIVKPAFPPKGSLFRPDGDYDGTQKFTSDLAEDFDDLISGKGELRRDTGEKSASGNETSGGEATPKKGRFKAATIALDLELRNPVRQQQMSYGRAIINIDAAGNVTGSYDIEWIDPSPDLYAPTKYFENATLSGKAVYPKTKGGKIRMELKAVGHYKTILNAFKDVPPAIKDEDYSDKGLVAEFSTDYSAGEGYIWGQSAYFKFSKD